MQALVLILFSLYVFWQRELQKLLESSHKNLSTQLNQRDVTVDIVEDVYCSASEACFR